MLTYTYSYSCTCTYSCTLSSLVSRTPKMAAVSAISSGESQPSRPAASCETTSRDDGVDALAGRRERRRVLEIAEYGLRTLIRERLEAGTGPHEDAYDFATGEKASRHQAAELAGRTCNEDRGHSWRGR
ncbi:MAG TPA: hypothetical protein VF192_04305 [Longimicrobiales bacterium]